MALDFRDIWIPHIRYSEIENSPASVRMSSAAMNCQRAKRLPHIAVVVSSHGFAGWQRMAMSKMEIIAQATVVAIVLHIAITCPRPGVNRRKRKEVDSLVKRRVTMYRISELKAAFWISVSLFGSIRSMDFPRPRESWKNTPADCRMENI